MLLRSEAIEPGVRAAMERDGFAPLGRVAGGADLVELRVRCEALVRDPRAAPKGSTIDIAQPLSGTSERSVFQRIDLYRDDPFVAAFVFRDDLAASAAAVLGRRLRLLRDTAFFKPARRGGEVYLHQDNRYWHLDPPEAVTIWIALDDATVENGCLHYIPGSHRIGRVSHVRAAGGTSVLLEAEADKRLAVPVELRAGEAVMHFCTTLHYSPANSARRPRRAYSIQYVVADALRRGEPVSGPAIDVSQAAVAAVS